MTGGFVDRLVSCRNSGTVPVIAEIKPFSVVCGDLLRGREPEHLVEEYTAGGAACLSVVTGRWFGGEPRLLERVAKVSTLPILRKDFIRSAGDIRASHDLGAHAVLLTAKLLGAARLRGLIADTLAVGLTPFVEVGNVRELEHARAAVPAIIAINNRDIGKKEADGSGVAKSVALIRRRGTEPATYVSASGIHAPQEALGLMRLGFDALLIGTALLREASAQRALQAFTSLSLDDGHPVGSPSSLRGDC